MAGDSATPACRPGWRSCLRSWFAWEPMRHAAWETVLFRAGIAWCAWQEMNRTLPFTSLPRPHGIAAWFDVTFCGNPQIMGWLSPLAAVCLALYVVGIPAVFTLALPLVLSVSIGTLGNSQGAINHTGQIVTMALLAQWLAGLWTATLRRRQPLSPDSLTGPQLAADWTRQVIMSTYVVSAISKLIESQGLWLSNLHYFGLQIVKSSGMAKYGDTGPGNEVQWLAQLFIDYPWMATIVLGAALPLELFAFLGLLNRRMALFFGLALLAFHSMVSEVMHLGFGFHKTLLLVLFVNPVWWAARGVARIGRRPRS